MKTRISLVVTDIYGKYEFQGSPVIISLLTIVYYQL